jgi:hypothetical protein
MLPLPNIKFRSLESILGFLSEDILVKCWNVSCMRWKRLSSYGWAVEVLRQDYSWPELVIVQGVGQLVVDGVPQLHQVQLVLFHLYQSLAIL